MIVTAAVALAFGSGPLEASGPEAGGEPGPAWKWTPEAVVDMIAVRGTQISPDGSSIVFTRSRWRPEGAEPGSAYTDIWIVPFEGGAPRRLTTADAADERPLWSPDGKLVAFLSDRGGEEVGEQIWVLPVGGGEAWRLTEGKSDVELFEWSPDGALIAYVAEDPECEEREKGEESGKDAIVVDQDLRPRRLWLVNVASRETEPLASLGDLSVWSFDWAPDGSALVAAVTDRNRMDDSFMFQRILVLPREGAARELVPVVGKIGDVAWSKDGRTIAWNGGVDGSDPFEGSLFVVSAGGGAPRNLTGAREESVTDFDWLPDGGIAVTSTVGTRSRVSRVDPNANAWETMVPEGEVAFTSSSWSGDGMRYAFTAATATYPNDVHAGSLEPPAPREEGGRRETSRSRRLVESNPRIASLPLGAQETIRYRARDGLQIEGVLVKPVGFDGETRHPLVVVVHGGPEGRYLDAWQTRYSRPAHPLAERGYMVFLPNYRGSIGRGVAYAKADHGDLGGKEFTDILDGIDDLARRGWIDPERVVMMGGSYGGYMTGLAVTRHSDRFAAGINFFGISSWESFMGQSDIPIEMSEVHWALWCYDHVDLCRERSAIGNIDRADTPTLILQGEEDLRVPKPQSDELYAALRWKKVPVEYVVYPREEHGFEERWHRLDALERVLRWIETYAGVPRASDK
jgi:dipeptidyl aminopeptidase/acylaminoacyl peptidase